MKHRIGIVMGDPCGIGPEIVAKLLSTQQVIENNFDFKLASSQAFAWRKRNPVPLYPGEKASQIKHIVFIAKENRTYDEVFGQLEKGDGDATIARYGENASSGHRLRSSI